MNPDFYWAMIGGGVQNFWEDEDAPENAPSRKFLDPSKRGSGLFSALGKWGRTQMGSDGLNWILNSSTFYR